MIDGLFGSGLSQQLQSGFVSLSQLVNESGAYVISLDIPSGLFGEWNADVVHRNIVHADLTLTFPAAASFILLRRERRGYRGMETS